MPRYFFHVHCKDNVQLDDEGLELSSLRKAVVEANQARAEIMSEKKLDELWLEIMDRAGHVVAKVG
jgi:2-iminoacetate synthase ThiH